MAVKDRLRVLQPNDPDSYYESRELVPRDMLRDIQRAKIVITNYHACKLRETLDLAKGTRRLLQGKGGEELSTVETEGQMLQRVMPGHHDAATWILGPLSVVGMARGVRPRQRAESVTALATWSG